MSRYKKDVNENLWDNYLKLNLENCFSMPGGVGCPKCRKSNTAQIKRVEIVQIGSYPLIAFQFHPTLLCDRCQHEWILTYSIEPLQVTETSVTNDNQ